MTRVRDIFIQTKNTVRSIMKRAVLLICLLLISGHWALFDQKDYVRDFGSVFCPFTDFCHFNATKKLNDSTVMPSCLPCSCAENCWKVGDCCPDLDVTGYRPPEYTCKDIYVKRHHADKNYIFNGFDDDYQRYRIIDRCNYNETNATLLNGCEGNNELRDVEDLLWVSDQSNGKTFVNRHCALCNDVTNYITWPLRTNSQTVFTNFDDTSFAGIDLIVEVPTSMRAVIERYRCFMTDFVQCNQFGLWKTYDENLEKGCQMYDSPIILTVGMNFYYTFKNLFCYMCNGEMRGSIVSTVSRSFRKKFTPLGIDFIAVIDFHTRQNDDVRDNVTCGVDEIYDQFMDSCHKLLCPFGSYPLYGNCKNKALQTRGLQIAAYYHLDRVLPQPFISSEDFNSVDKKTLGKNIVTSFSKLLGAENFKCPFCQYRLFMGEGQTNKEITDFILAADLYTDTECQLDIIFSVFTQTIGKNITIVLNESMNFTAVLKLDTNPLNAFSSRPYTLIHKKLEKLDRSCDPLHTLATEKICPRVELNYTYLISKQDSSSIINRNSLFSSDVEHDSTDTVSVRVCWDDYLWLMTPTSRAVFFMGQITPLSAMLYAVWTILTM